MAEPTVSAGLARGLLNFAVSLGAEEAALRRAADLEGFDLTDPDSRVPFGAYVKLVRAGKAMTGEPALPLVFAEAIDLAEYSVVGLLANAAETMMDSFNQLNRYGQLVVEVDVGEAGRFLYEPREGGMWLIDNRSNPNEFFELTESAFTRLITGPRRFLPRPHVLEAWVTHPEPAHRAVYDRIWRCPISFNAPWNGLRMDASLATHRVRLEPEYVFGVLSKHAEQLLKDLEQAKTTRGRVESLIMPIGRRELGLLRSAPVFGRVRGRDGQEPGSPVFAVRRFVVSSQSLVDCSIQALGGGGMSWPATGRGR